MKAFDKEDMKKAKKEARKSKNHPVHVIEGSFSSTFSSSSFSFSLYFLWEEEEERGREGDVTRPSISFRFVSPLSPFADSFSSLSVSMYLAPKGKKDKKKAKVRSSLLSPSFIIEERGPVVVVSAASSPTLPFRGPTDFSTLPLSLLSLTSLFLSLLRSSAARGRIRRRVVALDSESRQLPPAISPISHLSPVSHLSLLSQADSSLLFAFLSLADQSTPSLSRSLEEWMGSKGGFRRMEDGVVLGFSLSSLVSLSLLLFPFSRRPSRLFCNSVSISFSRSPSLDNDVFELRLPPLSPLRYSSSFFLRTLRGMGWERERERERR